MMRQRDLEMMLSLQANPYLRLGDMETTLNWKVDTERGWQRMGKRRRFDLMSAVLLGFETPIPMAWLGRQRCKER